ncbi:CatB-related O-acetyltransferase [Pseudomonas aeruginosa]|uniref:CatB-related O-acetyltransferase n=1 Tax=Pseudomonas aeruginosa TaxID=287 RepID=UPI000463B36E|nr:CatB-related O-acetyltransferase [Pseudomonas aeruginosa]MBI8969384.1 CatB-related O-acetyltransferase [Pseudomonas aeruginosa]MCO2227638.1 CatB-related O-acetyltransferase [Pseudomonas aeruginosa]MCO2232594.1 CatB-related O-acetyltransferase [Pseudomonas aeruginosa]MCO2239068.1 CatB-related O-acetyltransferase [Pseudomonas aeruginosa]MCO2334810.1 CatB-related O-acetyltransferase [Pseudomonas aeruginosa]
MNIFREALLNRRLKKALARHGCRMASGVETLRDGTVVTLEPKVKLGKAKIYSPALAIGAYTDVVSGCEFMEVSSIGRFCSIATGVVIGQPRRSHPMHWLSTHAFSANSKRLRKSLQDEPVSTPTQVGHDVWIGRDALILDGVSIGTGAVIGAQSLVNRDVPPYAVVAGSPARVLRYRFEPELIERLLASRWWELPVDLLCELPLDDPQACLDVLEQQPAQVRQDAPRLRIRHKPFAIERL